MQYASGLRLNLDRLGNECAQRGILFCVDAIHSLGTVPVDARACQAHFVMADGQKWLLAPQGCAVFYASPAAREQLRLRQFGWHMVEDHFDFSRREWQPAASARRFECGSPNMLGIHALSASLDLLLEVGIQEVGERVLANSAFLLSQLASLPGIELLTPSEPERHAGIVSFNSRHIPPGELHRRLLARGIFCAQRGAGVRFSPHFYTPRAHLVQALAAVEEFTQGAT